jgi:hypothetical protein
MRQSLDHGDSRIRQHRSNEAVNSPARVDEEPRPLAVRSRGRGYVRTTV